MSSDIKLYRRNFDISFNELLDMYRNKELIIRPEFQRLFRWSDKQQSLFIETLLLDMPVPPIYVDEQQDGSYILIDGLQRISTYLSFRGVELSIDGEILDNSDNIISDYDEDDESDEISFHLPEAGFKLSGCEVDTRYNGKTFFDLEIVDSRNLKRAFVRVEVLTKENPKNIKYHMFKRLNSGGSHLEPQELRNSNIRMIDDTFINFINSMSKNSDFVEITKYLSILDIQKMKREELVLRYYLFKNEVNNIDEVNTKVPLQERMTEFLEAVTRGEIAFDYDEESTMFNEMCKYLLDTFGADIFGGHQDRDDHVKKKLVLYNYDAFMMYFSDEDNRKSKFEYARDIHSIKKSQEYLKYKTGGILNVIGRVDYIRSKLG